MLGRLLAVRCPGRGRCRAVRGGAVGSGRPVTATRSIMETSEAALGPWAKASRRRNVSGPLGMLTSLTRSPIAGTASSRGRRLAAWNEAGVWVRLPLILLAKPKRAANSSTGRGRWPTPSTCGPLGEAHRRYRPGRPRAAGQQAPHPRRRVEARGNECSVAAAGTSRRQQPNRASAEVPNATAPSRRGGGRCHRSAWRRAWGPVRPRVPRWWW